MAGAAVRVRHDPRRLRRPDRNPGQPGHRVQIRRADRTARRETAPDPDLHRGEGAVTVIIAAMVMSVLAAIVILSVSLIGQRRWETREVAAIAAGILDDINQYGSVEVPVLEDPI